MSLRRRGRTAGALTVALALGGCAGLPDPGSPVGIKPEVATIAVDLGAARRLIAAYREAHRLGSVDIDPVLVRVAERQALGMARADLLDHAVVGDLSARVEAEGLRRGAEAENVSAGYLTLERALLGWERSRAHNDNLLFRPIRRIGIAAARAPGTRYGVFWALVMTD